MARTKGKRVGSPAFINDFLHLKLSVLYLSQDIHSIEICHLFLPPLCTLVHNLFASPSQIQEPTIETTVLEKLGLKSVLMP